MKILIFGAGGIGSVVGGFLARMGHDVTLLGRAWHLDAIRKNGLVITGIWGEYRIKAFDLFTDAGGLQKTNPEFDLIVLTVKSYDTERALEEISPLMKVKTTLLSLQNGLGNIETILKTLSAEQLLVGRVIFGVETQPGVARVTVIADDTVIGPAPGAKPKNLSAEQVAHLFSLAKIPTRPAKHILPFIWAKVIYNCALNGICSIHEMPYGKILENPETKSWMEMIIRECYAVGSKKGIALDPPTADEFIDRMIKKLIPSTASHHPSMLQDLRRGRQIDIDALNDAICRLGKELNVSTPMNQQITNKINESIFEHALKKVTDRHDKTFRKLAEEKD